MKTKECFKCGVEKPLTEFYKHSGMKDGYLGKCKECTKQDVHQNYQVNKEYYQQYELDRNQKPERKEQQTRYSRNAREKYPEKYKARTAVSNALRDGRLIKEPCIVCGDIKVEAHHTDYSKLLEVVWLCLEHHRQEHEERDMGTEIEVEVVKEDDRNAKFLDELCHLINKRSMENESNTPDWILAEYLYNCLLAYEETVRARDTFYGENHDG